MRRDIACFGQDPANLSAILDELLALTEEHPDVQWAALVDAAFDYPAAPESPYWSRGINCYGGPEYDGLSKVAPVLVPFDITIDRTFLARLLRHCHNRPMISFLGSSLALSDLCEAWRQLHWITAIDNQRMLLRLADTRVLIKLSQVLEPAQWTAFAGPVVKWVAVNRNGRLTTLARPHQNDIPVQKIHLDQDQLGKLLAAAEPDNILALISGTMSEVIPEEMRGSQRYETAAQSCAMARKSGISEWSDIVSLSVAAFLSNGTLIQDERFAAYLLNKSWPPGELGSSLVSERFL